MASDIKLNEREKTIVNLINNLAEVANDESTTQEAIDRIITQIRKESQENIKEEMKKAEEAPERPQVAFPTGSITEELKNSIESERQRMLDDIKGAEQVEEPTYLNKFIFTRVREVEKPSKAHPTDAGIDFFIPYGKAWDDDFKAKVEEYSRNPVFSDNPDCKGVEFKNGRLVVYPGAHVAIPSGIKTIIPNGYGMMFVNKSGVATKLKLDHSACLVDSEYRDEIIMCFFNHSLIPVELEPGQKITQGLIVPIINLEIAEVLNCVWDDIKGDSDRGGGFGSSDKKNP